mgnify:CR=1
MIVDPWAKVFALCCISAVQIYAIHFYNIIKDNQDTGTASPERSQSLLASPCGVHVTVDTQGLLHKEHVL